MGDKAEKPEHRFVESLGDYDLYCGDVKAAFIPRMIARSQVIKCPLCGNPANYEGHNSLIRRPSKRSCAMRYPNKRYWFTIPAVLLFGFLRGPMTPSDLPLIIVFLLLCTNLTWLGRPR